MALEVALAMLHRDGRWLMQLGRPAAQRDPHDRRAWLLGDCLAGTSIRA